MTTSQLICAAKKVASHSVGQHLAKVNREFRLLDFDAIVSALVYSFINELCIQPYGAKSYINGAVHFVQAQVKAMPDFAKPALTLLTLLLNCLALLATGQMFYCLPHEQRLKLIAFYRSSRLRLLGDVIRFYETVTLFGFYAHKEEHDTLLRENLPQQFVADRLKVN